MLNLSGGRVMNAPKPKAPRRSPGKDRAAHYEWIAKDRQRDALRMGNAEAHRIAYLAECEAQNAWNCYDASQGLGGGSSRGFSLRTEGRRRLDKVWKSLERVKAMLGGRDEIEASREAEHQRLLADIISRREARPSQSDEGEKT
jgi:hypothetical protein